MLEDQFSSALVKTECLQKFNNSSTKLEVFDILEICIGFCQMTTEMK